MGSQRSLVGRGATPRGGLHRGVAQRNGRHGAASPERRRRPKPRGHLPLPAVRGRGGCCARARRGRQVVPDEAVVEDARWGPCLPVRSGGGSAAVQRRCVALRVAPHRSRRGRPCRPRCCSRGGGRVVAGGGEPRPSSAIRGARGCAAPRRGREPSAARLRGRQQVSQCGAAGAAPPARSSPAALPLPPPRTCCDATLPLLK